MPSRFEMAPEWVVNLVDKVRDQYFTSSIYSRVRIAVLWDTRHREKGGMVVLGRIKKAGDVERLLAEGAIVPADDLHGLAYVLFLDKAVFEAIEEPDRIRIIRHELRHIRLEETDDGELRFKVWEHDIQDFKAEVLLNKDDPDWWERVRLIVGSVYDEKGNPLPKPDPNQGEMFEENQERDGVINLDDRRVQR